MNSPDELTLEDQVRRGSRTRKGTGRKGGRVAGTAGLALGLAVVGAGVVGAGVVGANVAGATTNGASSKHAHPAGTRAPAGRPGNSRGRPGPKGGIGGARPAAFGTVATVGTNSFTLKTRGGSIVTVDVTDATTYRDRGVTSPSFADVKVGETVVVSGTETSGTVAATSVGIGTPGGPPGRSN